MKKFYKELLEELISSGELSPVSREKCGNASSAYMERRPEREKGWNWS